MERKSQDKKQRKYGLNFAVVILALLLCICFPLFAGFGCAEELPQEMAATSSENEDDEKDNVTDSNDTAIETQHTQQAQQAQQTQNNEVVAEDDKQSGGTAATSQEEAVTLPELNIDEMDNVTDLSDIDAETQHAQKNETAQYVDSQSGDTVSIEEKNGRNDYSAENQGSEEPAEMVEIYTHGNYELPEISLDD